MTDAIDDTPAKESAQEAGARAKQIIDDLRPGWDEAWEKQHGNVPRILYHYTGPGGFDGILNGQSLHASDAAFLNDSSELSFAQEILAEVLDIAADGKTSTAVTTFVERGKNTLLATMADVFGIYVVCFCEESDLLSQWRGYGSEGGGFSVGFDTRQWAQIPPVPVAIRRVIYSRNTQHFLLNQAVPQLLNALTDVEESMGADAALKLVPHCLGGLRNLIWECLFCFKHPAFEEEKEWRVVAVQERSGGPSSELAVRRGDHGFVPYLNLQLHDTVGVFTGRLPISRITIGPSPHPDLASRGVAALLAQHAYPWTHTQVVGSGVPLRV